MLHTMRTERVMAEGTLLLIDVTTVICDDGITRDIADPFVRVSQDGCIMPLALTDVHVSDQAVRDAIAVALMPNLF